MKANIVVKINLPFVESNIYKELLKIGHYNSIEKSWSFKLDDLPKVIRATNIKLEFEEKDARKIIDYCPPLIETIFAEPKKGKSGITVIEQPKFYEISEYRKVDGIIKELKHTVPTSMVETAWAVIKKHPRYEKIRSRILSREICIALNNTEFIIDGKFSFAKLFGSRKTYFKIFYYPIKVLEFYGAIEYFDTGHVSRLSEDWQPSSQKVVKVL
jgi:hypothetical protein